MNDSFLAGVIEGFYGPPWTRAERLTLFGWMADWGLNTYLYAPKDDLKQRAIWREGYTPAEAAEMRELIAECRKRSLTFFYAISPGLDIRYSSTSDLEALKGRLEQMRTLGCENFSLLFDDIPGRIDPADIARYGSLASAQAQLANDICRWIHERLPNARFLFCPTPYCGRMAERQHGGADYLSTIGRELFPEIDVFWTGPEIISKQITVDHVIELQSLLRRKPLIWDNIHANDYDGRRFFCGPYSGRPPELTNVVSGILTNPNNEFSLNFVPLRTLACFLQSNGAWNERQAYLGALSEWLPSFQTVADPITKEHLVLLADCHYLPFANGEIAKAIYDCARSLLGRNPAEWGDQAADFLQMAAKVRELCVRLPGLVHRPLFHALSRRVLELREEIDLLENYVRFKMAPANHDEPFHSDFHLPGTYRGGFVPELQRLLVQCSDGSFAPSTMRQPTPGGRA